MKNQDRRDALRAFAGIGLGAAAIMVAPGRAKAQDQKLAQEVVQYQKNPKDGAECDKTCATVWQSESDFAPLSSK